MTGVAILTVASTSLKYAVEQDGSAVTILVVAPALVSAVLSVRAASAIAGQLTVRLRGLIALVGLIAVACAISLVVQHGAGSSSPKAGHMLQPLWLAAGGLLLGVAGALVAGAHKIARQSTYASHPQPGDHLDKSLSPPGAPRIPPPDRLIQEVEGDLVPWGWFDSTPQGSPPDDEDRRFWKEVHAEQERLVRWVRACVGFKPPTRPPPPRHSPRWWSWAV